MKIDLPTNPQRILIVKPSSLGDIVHALPILSPLKKRWPEVKISWLVMPGFASLLEGHPLIDRVIPFERNRLATVWRNPGVLGHLFDLRRELKDAQFDLVIDLQGLLRSGWLTALTTAPIRVGFDNAREGARWFYTHRVPVESDDVHAVDRYLSVVAALGCDISEPRFEFAIDQSDRDSVKSMLSGFDRYAVLMPGTNWLTKRWPAEYFAQTVQPLRELGLRVVIAGGADAVSLSTQIDADLNLSGKTNLRQLVALLEGAEVVIANDSGPMHIAAALGTPLVTMFGPTNPVRTGPYRRDDSVIRVDIPCSPCYSRRCSHVSCMKWLRPEHVVEAARVQLGGER